MSRVTVTGLLCVCLGVSKSRTLLLPLLRTPYLPSYSYEDVGLYSYYLATCASPVAQKMHKKAQATADARVHGLFVTTMAAAPPAAGATPTQQQQQQRRRTPSLRTPEHYAALPNDLQGCYNLLLAPNDPARGRSHQQLLPRLLLSMSDTSPKAFVGLVEHYCTVLVHRITPYSRVIIQSTCRIGIARC